MVQQKQNLDKEIVDKPHDYLLEVDYLYWCELKEEEWVYTLLICDLFWVIGCVGEVDQIAVFMEVVLAEEAERRVFGCDIIVLLRVSWYLEQLEGFYASLDVLLHFSHEEF